MISFISYSYYNLWNILRILSKKNFNDIQVRGKSTSIEPHLRLLYSRVQAKYFTYQRFQPWVSHK